MQALSSVLELIAGALVFMAINKKRAVLMTPILAYAVSQIILHTFLKKNGFFKLCFQAISLFFIAIACILCVYGLFDQHSVVPNWIR